MSIDPGNPSSNLFPPAPIREIGLAAGEAEALAKMAARKQGFILFSGPERSGKSHTANALLAEVDPKERRLVSIEKPVEYSLPFQRQMEVDDTKGDALELLFLDVVDESPEIFFLGEIQNRVGALMCTKYAAKGRLVVSTLASCNATTALFRLERLGVPRAHLGEALAGVVAQRLFPILCPNCREARPITKDERDLLAPLTSAPPEYTAHPVGCGECGNTGYRGKKPVIEIIEIDPELAKAITDGVPISTLRRQIRSQGVSLLSDGGLRGIVEGEFNLQDLYDGLFLEELDRDMAASIASSKPSPTENDPSFGPEGSGEVVEESAQYSILVVEDEPETRHLVDQILSSAGYQVTLAEDGAEALLKLATHTIDLILSDLYMPNLDGMKLLELVQQHGIEAPVVFLTGAEGGEVEQRAYELGAIDFLRKPVNQDVLLETLEIAFAFKDE
jgi:CheY-like chemotaxis protein